MRTILLYTAGLVAVYLLVSNATGAGRLISAGSSAYTGAVRTLQGR
jgi:hypothetical protein